MTVYDWIILALWLLFLAYWAASAVTAKRTVGGTRGWGAGAALRLCIVVAVLLLLKIPGSREALRRMQELTTRNAAAGVVGALLCAQGIGLAIWARTHLGRNWGMPMTRKDDPELVTTGPYAFVRHPIYTGVLLAMLGSAIGTTLVWGAMFVPFCIYFVYSARREEQLMTAQFPEQYPAYVRRTKMLVPFVV